MNTTTLLEAAMLICFGAAWPLANLRMIRSRRAEGRGILPTSLVLAGYNAGIAAKILCAWCGGALAPIVWLYLLNAASVGLNLWLQFHFGRHESSRGPGDFARSVLQGVRGPQHSARAAALR
jgi:hypothetical protein